MILLGSAGQRILTAGEILCLAGLHAGLNVTQKNDYDITVLRGPSISEMILSPQAIDYTGIEPARRWSWRWVRRVWRGAGRSSPASTRRAPSSRPPAWRSPAGRAPHPPGGLQGAGVQGHGLGPGIAGGAGQARTVVIRPEMLEAALAARLKGDALAGALEIVRRVSRGDG
ncbi:MAG: hypothetical protein MZV70_41825 [Desulfobacterales bacterium]|nr:hypothetical protein [Desulfobacterales bacterium]